MGSHHGSGGQSPTSHSGGLSSIPRQSVWNLWWTKWQCDWFLSQYFSFPCQYHSTIAPYPSIHLPPTLYNVFLPALQFPLSVSFHHCSILTFILILPFIRRTSGRSPETFQKAVLFRKSESAGQLVPHVPSCTAYLPCRTCSGNSRN